MNQRRQSRHGIKQILLLWHLSLTPDDVTNDRMQHGRFPTGLLQLNVSRDVRNKRLTAASAEHSLHASRPTTRETIITRDNTAVLTDLHWLPIKSGVTFKIVSRTYTTVSANLDNRIIFRDVDFRM